MSAYTKYSGYDSDKTISDTRKATITLLVALQKSIPSGLLNPLDYWSIFENRLRAAAMQNVSLIACFEQLKRKLKVEHITGDMLDELTSILSNSDSTAILNEMRENPTLLVMYVRLEQQARKSAYEAKGLENAQHIWELPEAI